jgi:ribosomal-protein-alanine acetyltransferase
MGEKSTALIRPAVAGDLAAIDAIQAASPEAARWDPQNYLLYECLVAVEAGAVVGFVTWRELGNAEAEILNLAVDPRFRRSGVGARLLREAVVYAPRTIHLEVRASNQAARALYRTLGFRETGIRQRYYDKPPEDGIVMTLQSC